MKFGLTLSGAIAVWARARNLPVTKKDCDELAEAIELLFADRSEED